MVIPKASLWLGFLFGLATLEGYTSNPEDDRRVKAANQLSVLVKQGQQQSVLPYKQVLFFIGGNSVAKALKRKPVNIADLYTLGNEVHANIERIGHVPDNVKDEDQYVGVTQLVAKNKEIVQPLQYMASELPHIETYRGSTPAFKLLGIQGEDSDQYQKIRKVSEENKDILNLRMVVVNKGQTTDRTLGVVSFPKTEDPHEALIGMFASNGYFLPDNVHRGVWISKLINPIQTLNKFMVSKNTKVSEGKRCASRTSFKISKLDITLPWTEMNTICSGKIELEITTTSLNGNCTRKFEHYLNIDEENDVPMVEFENLEAIRDFKKNGFGKFVEFLSVEPTYDSKLRFHDINQFKAKSVLWEPESRKRNNCILCSYRKMENGGD